MQVYILTWDGQQSDPDAFRNFSDIEPSIRISFGQAKDLQIKMQPREAGGPTFIVTGTMDGKPFEERLHTRRMAVYDSPTHL